MPGRAIEHGDGARAERRRARPGNRGLLSPGQALSGTNAAPTQHERRKFGNSVRRGAFAHTSTRRASGPSHTARRANNHRPNAVHPQTDKETTMKITQTIRALTVITIAIALGLLVLIPQTPPPRRSR